MKSKGRARSVSGEESPCSKLTWSQVRQIRSLALQQSNRVLGKKFGVDGSTIWKIVHNKRWREGVAAVMCERRAT